MAVQFLTLIGILLGILTDDFFDGIEEANYLHNGYHNIVTIKDERSPKHKCLGYCSILRTCRGVDVKYLSRDEVSCAIYHEIPEDGYQGNNTGWQLYTMDQN